MMMDGKDPVVRVALDVQLKQIKQDLVRLGTLVIQAMDRSMQALQENDKALAERVIHDDQFLNEVRFGVEELCLELIATQQPAAGDLRSIVAAMTIVGDLERMGDHVAGIAKTVLRMDNPLEIKPESELLQMAMRVRMMLQRGMEAYENADPHLAYRVATMDDAIDSHYRALFREYLGLMADNPESAAAILYLLFSGHNLERIGDRVTNIAERVIFMTSGELEELNI